MPMTAPRGRRFVPAPVAGTIVRAYEALTMPTDVTADDAAYSMGLEFYVTGLAQLAEIRFYQAPNNTPSTATRTGQLWHVDSAAAGTPVSAIETFPTLSTGWQTLTLSSPVLLTPNERYRAVVLHPAGRYAATPNYYASGGGATDFVSGVLTVPSGANATGADQNAFNAGATMAFPADSFNATHYGLDVGVQALT